MKAADPRDDRNPQHGADDTGPSPGRGADVHQTLPTIAWGTLRHGIEPELYALATIVNLLVFALLFIIFLLTRLGALRLGVPED